MIPVAMAYAEMAGVPSQSLWLWARGQPPHRLLTEVTVVDFPLIALCRQQGAARRTTAVSSGKTPGVLLTLGVSGRKDILIQGIGFGWLAETHPQCIMIAQP
jgi:hypothetical protein